MAQPEKSKELDILLALAMTEHKRSLGQQNNTNTDSQAQMDCPDEELLACYFDGRLSETERNELFKRLLECPESYAQWVTMAETLGYHLEQEHPQQQEYHAINEHKASWLEQLMDWLASYQAIWASAVVLGVVFVVVIGLNNNPISQPSIQEQIAENWQNNQHLYLAQMDVSEFVARRQTKSTLEVVPFAEKKAFANGFRQGIELISQQQSASTEGEKSQSVVQLLEVLPQQNLACKNQRCDVETPVNEQVGKWSALMLHQCQQGTGDVKSQNYWQQQRQLYTRIKQEYQSIDQRFGMADPQISSINHRIVQMAPEFAQLPQSIATVCESINQLALYALQK